MHDAKTVKERLLGRVEEVCHFLFPSGKTTGHEFCVGSLQGEAGASLKVELRGAKAGVWKDFASGDAGDIYDLWAKAKGSDFKTIFPEVCRYLGITNLDRPKPKAKPPAPDISAMAPMTGTPAMAYLTDKRGITADTLKAYRVRSHKRPSDHNQDFVAFYYTDSEGEPVMLKSTGIKPTAEGKKDIWTTAPYYTLWGWWLVTARDRTIIITEGEVDAMSVHQLNPGMPVLSLPSGASNLTWIENDYDTLARFERIYICTDMDEPGEKAAQEIAKRLGLARCYRLPIPGGMKDANEVFTKDHGDENFFEFSTWISRAVTYDPPTLRGASAFRQDVKARLRREKREDECNTFVFPDIPFQLRDGECTLLTGYTGHGKSEGAYQILTHEMASGNKTAIASYEIDASEMICNIGTQLLAHKPTEDEADKIIDWLDGKLWFITPKDDETKAHTAADIFADFQYAASRFDCTRFLVDSLMFVCKKDDYEGQDLLAKKCRDFGRKDGRSHVILIAHAAIKKGEEKVPTMSDVMGSAGILAPFNNVLIWWRNVAKEEAMEKALEEKDEAKVKKLAGEMDALLYCAKQRRTGKRFKRKLWFDTVAKVFRTKPADKLPPMIETQPAQRELLPADEDKPF